MMANTLARNMLEKSKKALVLCEGEGTRHEHILVMQKEMTGF